MIKLFRGLINKTINVKCLPRCLIHRKYSVMFTYYNINYYYYNYLYYLSFVYYTYTEKQHSILVKSKDSGARLSA